jgi:hypothetical protein
MTYVHVVTANPSGLRSGTVSQMRVLITFLAVEWYARPVFRKHVRMDVWTHTDANSRTHVNECGTVMCVTAANSTEEMTWRVNRALGPGHTSFISSIELAAVTHVTVPHSFTCVREFASVWVQTFARRCGCGAGGIRRDHLNVRHRNQDGDKCVWGQYTWIFPTANTMPLRALPRKWLTCEPGLTSRVVTNHTGSLSRHNSVSPMALNNRSDIMCRQRSRTSLSSFVKWTLQKEYKISYNS